MKKKASLSLSINAIVILVLAITMLGLGLGFTKGMFGKLSSKLSVPEPDIPATAEEPIVLPSDELVVTKNKQFIFSVNVYNENFEDAVTGELTCPAEDGAEAIPNAAGVGIVSGPQEITAGEDKGFKFIIDKTLVTTSSTRICKLSFSDGPDSLNLEQKQVVLDIK